MSAQRLLRWALRAASGCGAGLRRALPVLAVALLAGCSAVQFGYRNADTLVRWQANAYFDFEGAATEERDRRIAAFLAWHRARALPQYARLADEASSRAARPLSREDLVWGYDAIRGQLREGLRAAAAESAPLLDRLTPEQLAHFERRLAEDNRKFAKEQLAGSAEDRRKRRLKRNLERLEDWVGTLTEAQVERVRQYSERAPASEALRDRDRKRRQAELLAMLRAREATRRLPQWAADWDGGREPAYAEAAKTQLALYMDLLLDLDRTLSPAQREHLVRHLKGYAEDFAALAREAGAAK